MAITKKKEWEEKDKNEIGCWVRLRLMRSCISSKSKVDSSISSRVTNFGIDKDFTTSKMVLVHVKNIGCQKSVHEQLTLDAKSELKAGVLHDLKEIGSAIYWMGLLDLVLREVDSTQFMQTAPWLGVILELDEQVIVVEASNIPIINLFKAATAVIVRNPVCSNPSLFLTMSKQAEAAGLF